MDPTWVRNWLITCTMCRWVIGSRREEYQRTIGYVYDIVLVYLTTLSKVNLLSIAWSRLETLVQLSRPEFDDPAQISAVSYTSTTSSQGCFRTSIWPTKWHHMIA